MTPQETYILTHYTEIAETKQRDVRRIQAETALSILQSVVAAMVKGLRRAPHRKEVQELDQA